MLLTEMTPNDLMLLEQLRIERLRGFFIQSLSHCIIIIHSSYQQTLIVHCPEPLIVDTLLNELQELSYYAWLILGVEAISLYFVQEEICRVVLRSDRLQIV